MSDFKSSYLSHDDIRGSRRKVEFGHLTTLVLNVNGDEVMKKHIRTCLLFVWICMAVVVAAQDIKAPTTIVTIKWQASGEFFW
jgi:hypothetical protein